MDDLANNSNGKLPPQSKTTTNKKLSQPLQSSSSGEHQGSVKTTAPNAKKAPPPRGSTKWKWTNDEDPVKLYNMDK